MTYLREGALGEDAIDHVSTHHLFRSMITTYIRRQVLPQAPSPTMTSLRRISAMVKVVVVDVDDGPRVVVFVDDESRGRQTRSRRKI